MPFRSIVLSLAFLACSPGVLALRADAFHAGVRTLDVQPGVPRNWRGAPSQVLHCTLWYPTEATVPESAQQIALPGLPPLFESGLAASSAPLAHVAGKLPLVVLSHGLGGTADQFGWLAPELARRGYLVLGVNHPGNNSLETLTPEGALLWGERAQDISDAIDGLLADRVFGSHVDGGRIGAIGYSLGSETVLALAGAHVDQDRFFSYCLTHRTAPTCGLPAFTSASTPEEMLAAVRMSSADALLHQSESRRDTRIRAVFAMAPPLGEAFSRESFTYVDVPVTLVAGAADTIAPPEANAERFATWLPAAKIAVLKGAGHYTFLDTCTPAGAQAVPQFCEDPVAVDRNAVHEKTTAMAILFFDNALRARSVAATVVNTRPQRPVDASHVHANAKALR